MNQKFVIGTLIVGVPAALIGAVKLSTVLDRARDFEPIEQHRVEGNRQLERLRAVTKAVEAQPPLSADTESFPFTQADFRRYPPKERRADGAFVELEQLEAQLNGKESGVGWISLEQSPFWGRCIAWLSTGRDPGGEAPKFHDVIEDELQAFLAVRYLGVARTVELQLPEATSDAQFSAGRWRFDVYFYELSDEAKYLGGVRIDAVNDPTVKVKYAERSRKQDMKEYLLLNLRWRTQDRLLAALSARAPGVTLEPPSEYQPDITK